MALIENKPNRNSVNFTFFMAYGALAIAMVCYTGWFWIFLKGKLSSDPAVWGQFGDFFNGVSTPVITFFALMWLIQSVQLQKTEMAKTSEALEKSEKSQAELVKQGRINLQIAATTALIQVQTNAYQAITSELRDVKEQEDAYLSKFPDLSMQMLQRLTSNFASRKEHLSTKLQGIQWDIDRYHAELVGLLKNQTDAVVSLPSDNSESPDTFPTTVQSSAER